MARGGTNRVFDTDRKAAYVQALEKDGDHAFARIEVGITQQSVSTHRKKDVEFDLACEDAMQAYRKTFIDEIVRRGRDGIEEPIFKDGELVGHTTKYSDKLLLEHTKVVDDRYQTKLQLDVAAHITTTELDLEKLQPESRELLQRILEIEAAAAPIESNDALAE